MYSCSASRKACQDISNAGRGEGITGARSGLWKECFRVLSEMRPRIALIENVDALLRRGLDVAIADLRSIGYHLEWDIIPAAAVGAPHLRQRFFGVARPAELAGGRVYGDVAYDKHGEPITFDLGGKLPRAGWMGEQNLVLDPIAPRKTKRADGWTYWVGADLMEANAAHLWPTLHGVGRDEYTRQQGPSGNELGRRVNQVGQGLWPTPSARDHKDTGDGCYGRGQLPEAIRLWGTLNAHPRTHTPRRVDHGAQLANQVAALLPTPAARDDGKSPEAHMRMKANLPGGPKSSITSLAVLARNGFKQPSGGLWRTPSASDGTGGGMDPATRLAQGHALNLREQVFGTGRRGSLNPTWVEHIMAMPLYWTDPDFPTELTVPVPWWHEPPMEPRTDSHVRHRTDRLRAIGNSVVWPCAYVALERALAATPLEALRFAA